METDATSNDEITIMCFNVVGWYTTLANPTIESGYSVVFGCFSACFAVWRQERRPWLLLMVIAEVVAS